MHFFQIEPFRNNVFSRVLKRWILSIILCTFFLCWLCVFEMLVIEVRFAEMEKEDQLNDGSQASLLCIKENTIGEYIIYSFLLWQSISLCLAFFLIKSNKQIFDHWQSDGLCIGDWNFSFWTFYNSFQFQLEFMYLRMCRSCSVQIIHKISSILNIRKRFK